MAPKGDNHSVTAPTSQIPLIDLPSSDKENADLKEASSKMVGALQTSGFLLVQSPDLGLELQESALEAASKVLIGDKTKDEASTRVESVIDHPTDPKLYLMLDSLDDIATKCGGSGNETESSKEEGPITVLTNFWKALEQIKRQILTCLALGLELEPDYFVKLHSKNQSALRLLHYPTLTLKEDESKKEEKSKPNPSDPVIRCKPHSDYGSITLLLTDGVPGLQALLQDKWTPVPHVKGALVVNIGSLLQDWTNGKLLATLHRVVALPDEMPPSPRTSLAFFADPDPDVSATLRDPSGMVPIPSMYKSVADYIQWRSGGKGRQRSGLAFSEEEEERVKRARTG